jgi:hypothetical protein
MGVPLNCPYMTQTSPQSANYPIATSNVNVDPTQSFLLSNEDPSVISFPVVGLYMVIGVLQNVKQSNGGAANGDPFCIELTDGTTKFFSGFTWYGDEAINMQVVGWFNCTNINTQVTFRNGNNSITISEYGGGSLSYIKFG